MKRIMHVMEERRRKILNPNFLNTFCLDAFDFVSFSHKSAPPLVFQLHILHCILQHFLAAKQTFSQYRFVLETLENDRTGKSKISRTVLKMLA